MFCPIALHYMKRVRIDRVTAPVSQTQTPVSKNGSIPSMRLFVLSNSHFAG
jgi:hypothetical protein